MAAAAMAASMFAVDVTGQLFQTTDLFNLGSKTVLGTPTTPTDINNSHIKFAVAKGDAGASFNFKDTDSTWENITLWCTPVEGLKVTLGAIDTGTINRGTFAWWHKAIRLPDAPNNRGIEFNFNAGPVAMDIVTSFGKPLFNFGEKGLAMIGNYFVGGTINLGAAGNLQIFSARGMSMGAYGVGGWEAANLVFGASYDHMPWQTTGGFVDVYANFSDKFAFDRVESQIGGQYCASGMAARLVAMVAYGNKYGTPDTLSYGFVAKGEYTIDSVNAYVQVMGNDMQAGTYGIEIGCDTNLGAAGLNAAVKIDIKKDADVAVSVPLTFKVGM